MNLQAENNRRNALLGAPYDPISGVGCAGQRVLVGDRWLPEALLADCPAYATLPAAEQHRRRVAHDFEYWCATCATVRDKVSGRPVPFVLNAAQRRVTATMEGQREQQQPVRIILLKARQWGGSTLVQMYMAWMQLVRHKGWNSLILGHKRQSARSIKGMYNLLLRHYPVDLIAQGDERPRFRNFEGSNTVQQVTGRDCLVLTGSAMSDDDVRGYSIAMAHLTEVAFWPHTAHRSPADVMRGVNGTVPRVADTVVVLESTANGVGQFFHTEWLRACAGQSDKTPIFVPWHEVEIYRSPVADAGALWHALTPYERALWDDGLTLEMLQWYHDKCREADSHAAMMAEFPSTSTEAFVCTGFSVFDLASLDALRADCRAPLLVGDVEGERGTCRAAHFVDDTQGLLKVWRRPADGETYIAAVDIGGRSDKADYSVIAVLCVTAIAQRRPEVVAQWRGHIDHDLLAWKAAHLAEMYNHALLVVESNTLESRDASQCGAYLLTVLRNAGVNLYARANGREGFHTNATTKPKLINNLISCVRDHTYVERDSEAVDEMATYETTPNGGYAARIGHHDDIVMTRAIALWVAQVDAGYQPPRHSPITSDDKRSLLYPSLFIEPTYNQ